MINTHHHFDHTGGLRAAIAEGLTIVAHQGNAALIEEIAERPRTLVPDALAKNPKPLMLQAISEDTVLSDSSMTVNLFLNSNVHSETLLYAYFPRERLLFQADLYNQGFAVHPYVGDLLEELKKRNLRVDRVMPGHGQVAPIAKLVSDAAAQPANATN